MNKYRKNFEDIFKYPIISCTNTNNIEMLTDFQSNNQYIQTLQGVAKEKTPGLGYVSCYPLILCQFSSTRLEAHLNFVFTDFIKQQNGFWWRWRWFPLFATPEKMDKGPWENIKMDLMVLETFGSLHQLVGYSRILTVLKITYFGNSTFLH